MKIIIIRSRLIDPAVFKLAESLSENGHSVTLLVWDRQNNFKNKKKKYYVQNFTLRAPYDKLTVLFYLPLWWIYEFYFLLFHHADVIHACDFDTLWPAVIVKSIKKNTLFYTIYDFYADNIPKLPQFIRKVLAFLEKKGIGFSNTLFLVDESRYSQVKGAKIEKLVYAYNSPHDNFYTYIPKKLDSKKFLVFYAGAIDKYRGLNYMIDAIKEIESLELIIAGKGNNVDMVEEASKTNKNIRYIGWLDYGEVLKNSLQADVLFAFYDPVVPNSKYASPNKLFEAMMCGKPIIINSETFASKIVQTENCGIIVDYGDVKSIRESLVKLKEKPNLRQKLGENGRNAYGMKYSWSIMERRLLNAYKTTKIE